MRCIVTIATILGTMAGVAAAERIPVTACGQEIAGADNGAMGVFADRVRVRDSTITGNGGDLSQCGAPQLCVDVFSYFQPHLVNTVCGTSVGPPPAFLTWGVCQDD